MKYKKWWLPAVFMVVSAVFLGVGVWVYLLLTEDNSMTNFIYYLIGMGIWFFLVVPVLSLMYTRKVLAGERERILLTLYNSVMLVLPFVIFLFTNFDAWLVLLMLFIWAEMWALLGLAGKGDKKSDVWYVPVFLGLAVIVVNMYLGYFFSGYLHTAIISCILCPIAIAVYTRVCVRDRNGKLFFTIYVSLAMFVAIFGYHAYLIINGIIELGSSAWDIIRLILSALGTFCLHELTAIIGAGYKIRLPKRKKAKGEEKTVEIGESRQ